MGSGVLFIWIGLPLRHRFGVWPLAAWTAAAMAFGSLALGSVAVDALDLTSEWGAWAVAFFLTPALLAAALVLHRLARRPRGPALEGGLPSALAAFRSGVWVGGGALIGALVLTLSG